MNSGQRHQPNTAGPALTNGVAELCGAVLRLKPGDQYAITTTPDGGLEIVLSATTVAELRASLKGPAPFRKYNTVGEEAKRHKFCEKTFRYFLKEKHAPHYSIGSDTRIDPVAMDEWMDKNCAIGGNTQKTSSSQRK